MAYFHIVDGDSRRRAQLARELASRNFHAEIYESIEEFFESETHDGFVLAHCDQSFDSSEAAQGQGPSLPVVIYGEQPSTDDVVRAMHAGAIDYFDWPIGSNQLDTMLRRVAQTGEEMVKRMRRQAEARKVVDKLSRRERQVLLELVNGKSTKQMGKMLGISPRTVEIYRGNMMKKLNAGSAAAAVRIALWADLEDELHQAA